MLKIFILTSVKYRIVFIKNFLEYLEIGGGRRGHFSLHWVSLSLILGYLDVIRDSTLSGQTYWNAIKYVL